PSGLLACYRSRHSTEVRLRGFAQFAVSMLIHSLVLLFVFLGAMGLIGAFGLQWQWPVGLGLLLVGAIGFAKRTRWGGKHQGSFVAGLVAAAAVFTAAWYYIDWGLSHPVGPLPSFRSHVENVIHQPSGVLLTLAPVVLTLMASAIGYQLAKRLGRAGRLQ